jgi:hypothetical protein
VGYSSSGPHLSPGSWQLIAGDGSVVFIPARNCCLTAVHDAGWVHAERQPCINAQGQPCTFTEMELDEHFSIWQGSIEAMFNLNRYGGLLTSLHCTALYERRLRYLADPPADRARIQAFLDTRYKWQDELIAALKDHPRYALAVEADPLAELRLPRCGIISR